MLFMILRGFVQAKALNSGVLPMIVHPAPRCSRHCFYFLEAVIAFDPIVHSSRGGGYSLIWVIQVCTAPKGGVF